MSQKKTKILSFLKLTKVEVLILLLMIFSLTMSLLYLHQFNYDSDDVAEQNIVHYISEFGLKDTWLPPDPWLLKFPLYAVYEFFSFNSRLAILTTSLIMNVFLAVAVFYFAKFIFIKSKIRTSFMMWLPLVWLFTLAPGFVQFIKIPNTRNMELGILLIAIALALTYYYRQKAATTQVKIIALLVLLLNGVSFYSDPYYMIFYVMFLSAFFVAEYIKNNLDFFKAKVLLAHYAVSVLVYFILKKGLASLGFIVNDAPVAAIGAYDLPERITEAIKGLVYSYSINVPVFNLSIMTHIVTFGSIVLGFSSIALSLFLIRRRNNSLLIALAVQPFIVLAAFILKDSVAGISSARYLILGIIYSTIVLSVFIASSRWGKFVGKFVLILVAINVLHVTYGAIQVARGQNPLIGASDDKQGVQSASEASSAFRNEREKKIIQEIQSRNVSKGYGDYWSALIVNYLSGYNINIGQVICDSAGVIRPYYWVVQDQIYKPTPAQGSFLVLNSKSVNYFNCDMDSLGKYYDKVAIDSHTVIFFYDYDIAVNFPEKATLSKPD